MEWYDDIDFLNEGDWSGTDVDAMSNDDLGDAPDDDDDTSTSFESALDDMDFALDSTLINESFDDDDDEDDDEDSDDDDDSLEESFDYYLEDVENSDGQIDSDWHDDEIEPGTMVDHDAEDSNYKNDPSKYRGDSDFMNDDDGTESVAMEFTGYDDLF